MAADDEEWQSFLREEAAGVPAQDAAATPPAPKYAGASPATAAFGQGVSLGFSDELGAAVDTGISKIPGVRNFAEAINSLGGGHPGLSPLTDPSLTYDQRRDQYRQRNAEMRQQAPIQTIAGQTAGAVAASPLLGPGSSASFGTRLAATGLEGTAAGVGVNERPEDIGKDMARGAAFGLAGGLFGNIAQRYIAGAPARGDARTLQAYGVTPKAAGRAKVKGGEISSGSDDVIALVKGDKALRAARGNPRAIVEANEAALRPLNARTSQIYSAADDAVGGGMDPVAVRQAVNAQLDKAISGGAPRTVTNRLKQVLDQVEALEVAIPWRTAGGSGTKRVIPSEKLRAFITDRLKPTDAEVKSGTAKAVDQAAIALKNALSKHVGKAAPELEQLNKEISTRLVLQEAAAKRFDATRYHLPGARPTLKQSAQAAAGRAADAVINAPGVGARTASNVEAGARRAVVQGVVDAAHAKDDQRALRMLEQDIFPQ